jgi:hypothetical protein
MASLRQQPINHSPLCRLHAGAYASTGAAQLLRLSAGGHICPRRVQNLQERSL